MTAVEITEATLYAECIKRGIPCHSHYSDLYIPVTPETRMLKKHFKQGGSCFINQVEGGLWFDVPFAFVPYWEQMMTKCRPAQNSPVT